MSDCCWSLVGLGLGAAWVLFAFFMARRAEIKAMNQRDQDPWGMA